MRLLLSIPSLERGGAERQFAALAAGLARRGHTVLAATLGRGGPLAGELGGARLVELGKRSRLDDLRTSLRLAGLLRTFRPDVHYAFLAAPDVLGGLLAPIRPGVPLVMGLRATRAGTGRGLAARLMEAFEARLSGRAAAVIVNSEAGRADALRRGFPPDRLHVVPNGIDTRRFRPERGLGARLRAQWSPGGGPLLGLVARLDPVKDHAVFLHAAALLLRRLPEARFVCVGSGPAAHAARLRGLARDLGLAGRLVWAGPRDGMECVYNALDLLCLTSAGGEGWPNVFGEAMSCGVPCVATDVGDAAAVLGPTGAVVPAGDAPALAAAAVRLLGRGDADALRTACRGRIVAHFDLERMVAATERLLLGL